MKPRAGLLMSDEAVIAIVGSIIAFLGTLLSAVMAYFMARLKEAAKDAAVQVKEVAVKQTIATARAEAVREDTRGKLANIVATGDATHQAVNGAMESQLRLTAIAMRRVADLTKNQKDIEAAELAEAALAVHVASALNQ